MKKKFLIIYAFSAIVLFFSIALLCMGCVPQANDPYGTVVRDDGWEILKVDVTIDVQKDKTAVVTERYEVDFFKPTYAFDRYLPITSGEKYQRLSASAEKANVTQSTRVYEESDYVILSVEFGSRIIGNAIFDLSYELIPPYGDRNDFYMNVIGQGFSTEQNDVTVTLNFPFEVSDPTVYCGKWGATDTIDTFSLSNDSKTLTITKDKLPYGNGVTAHVNIINNKFSEHFDVWLLIACIVAAVILFVLLLYFILGRQLPINAVVNFYPPSDDDGKELTPVDMGALIDKKCDDSDVTSLIFYWASKGAIEIIKDSSDDEDLVLKKKGELPENSRAYEKRMFAELFRERNRVSLEQLKYKFYPHVVAVKAAVTAQYDGKYDDKKTARFKKFLWILSLLLGLSLIIWGRQRLISFLDLNIFFDDFLIGVLVLVFASVFIYSFVSDIIAKRYKRKRAITLLYCVLILFVAVAIAILDGFVFIRTASMSVAEALIIPLTMTVSSFLCGLITRYSEYYTARLEQILGFREFLVTAEKERLETLLEENPEYYYDILPYANVLGVSDIWEEKFDGLTLRAPEYYVSDDRVFDIIIFNHFYRSAYKNISHNVMAPPRSSGGIGRGGFSGGGFHGGFGGGFSGGGFGGGGGGRR